MSSQVDDIAQEAQERLDALFHGFHGALRVFQEVADAMVTPRNKAVFKPTDTARPALKV